MSKNVYLEKGNDGRLYVREILPDEAVPIEDWYNIEFTLHCVSAPDDIKQKMLFDRETNTFYDWCPIEEDRFCSQNFLEKEIDKI